jgi:hypothetical protein
MPAGKVTCRDGSVLKFSVLSGALDELPALTNGIAAFNGYLHAATVIALADTTCGYGTRAISPGG